MQDLQFILSLINIGKAKSTILVPARLEYDLHPKSITMLRTETGRIYTGIVSMDTITTALGNGTTASPGRRTDVIGAEDSGGPLRSV